MEHAVYPGSSMRVDAQGTAPPASIGQLVSQVFSVKKGSLLKLAGIQLIRLVIGPLAFLTLVVIFSFEVADVQTRSFNGILTWIPVLWTGIGGLIAIIPVSELGQMKIFFITIAGSHRVLNGERATFSQIWHDSSGALRRALPAYGLSYLVRIITVSPIFVSEFFVLGPAVMQEDPDKIRMAFILLFASFLFACISSIVQLYLMIRWVYFGHLVTLEKTRSIESLRRAWRLTSNDFMHTLGFLFVGGLFPLAVAAIVPFFTLILLFMPVILSEEPGRGVDPGLSVFLILLTLLCALLFILQPVLFALANALFVVYLTAMYRDQCHRASLRERGIDPRRVLFKPLLPTEPTYPPGSSLPSHDATWQPPPNASNLPPILPPEGTPQYDRERSPWGRP